MNKKNNDNNAIISCLIDSYNSFDSINFFGNNPQYHIFIETAYQREILRKYNNKSSKNLQRNLKFFILRVKKVIKKNETFLKEQFNKKQMNNITVNNNSSNNSLPIAAFLHNSFDEIKGKNSPSVSVEAPIIDCSNNNKSIPLQKLDENSDKFVSINKSLVSKTFITILNED